MAFTDIYVLAILMAFLASCTLYYQKKRSLVLYFLPPFLLLAFLVESIGIWLWYRGINNLWLYLIFTTIEFIYYSWLISEVVDIPLIKKTLLHCMWVFPFLVILNKMFLQKGSEQYLTITYALGCLIIACAAMAYFFNLFQSNRYVNLRKDPFFWICSGLLFYYTCSFPFFTIVNILNSESPIFLRNYGAITSLLNILLYSSFIVASLCRISIRKVFV